MAGKAWRIAVIAGKGGVGKTTTVINLGAGLAASGLRVLLVDCDPQGNLSSGLGLDPYARRRTIADVIVGRSSAVDAIIETDSPGLHLIPAHPDLSAVESELPARVNAELRLRNALREGIDDHYDVVLMDTPPNFGFHTISALGAARSALVPLQMSAFALRGLKEVIRVIAAARRHLNTELELLGVVPTFVNNTRFSRDMLEALSEVSQVRVFRSEITLTVKLQESALQGVPVLVSSPSSRAANSYKALAAEVIEVGGVRLPEIHRAAPAPAVAAVAEPAFEAAVSEQPAAEAEQAFAVEEADDAPEAHGTHHEIDESWDAEETEEVDEVADTDEADEDEETFAAVADDDDDDDDEELDSGYAVTLAGQATQGAMALTSNGNGMQTLASQQVRRTVMLELELGEGGIAYAEMPSVGLHAVDEHHGDEVDDDDEIGDRHDEGADSENVAEERRRFRLFRRAKAS